MIALPLIPILILWCTSGQWISVVELGSIPARHVKASSRMKNTEKRC